MAIKDIIVRQIRDEDMLEVSEWYRDRKWLTPPGKNRLPETGYVSELNGELLAVVWLYITNSAIGITDWICTNPKFRTKGIISIREIFKFIEETTSGKIEVLMNFTSNEKLAKYLRKNCRFKKGETCHMGIRLF